MSKSDRYEECVALATTRTNRGDTQTSAALAQLIDDRTRNPRARGRIVFVPDYEMTLARHLVQGVDVWLNNPRRPLEASGTSGMKAALNGVVNCSVLDGWWCEGYSADTGFAIGGEIASDDAAQDAADAVALFEVLEQHVIPSYYDQGRWLWLMRNSIAQLGARFTTNRMLVDYVEGLQGAGFKVDNPNVIAACGCGSSFRVADEEEVSAV